MGFKEGQLFLDSPEGTYYSGQLIQGKLIFQEEKIKSIRGMYVKVKGFCHVHWQTTQSRHVNGRTETYTVNHDSHEEYINIRVYMLGGEAGDYTIQPGKYEFPFHFRLPNDCPSSFEGKYGHIRYEIKAVIERGYKFNEEKKVLARVMAPMNLNLDPYCKEPIEIDLQKLYRCCCVKTGSSDVSVKLPIGGYCPGQIIPIRVSCVNKGRTEINDIKLIIAKKITFIATNAPGKQIVKNNAVEIRKGPIPTNTTRNWTVDMEVPAMDVYNILTCQYIKVEYKFKVHVSPKGCHTNVGRSQRIVIGTIPLMAPAFNVLQEDNTPGVNPAYVEENYPENPPPYPGNLDDSQNVSHEANPMGNADTIKIGDIGITAHDAVTEYQIRSGPVNPSVAATAPASSSLYTSPREKKL